MMWDNSTWGSSGAAVMGLMMLVLTLVVVGFGVWVVRTLADERRHPRLSGGHAPGPDTAYDAAEQLLARRFAAGEVDEAQFDRARAALRRDRPGGPPA